MPYTISKNGSLETDELLLSERVSLRSEEVTDIISHKPGFLIRYGTTIFLLVLLLIVIACWFISYPDIVSGKAILTSLNAPKPLIAKADGKLVMLNIQEGQQVHTGDVVGYLESTASHEQVLNLSDYLDTLSSLLTANNEAALLQQKNVSFNNLGELQQPFQVFNQSFAIYSNYIGAGFYLKKQMMLAADKALLQQENKALRDQKGLFNQDVALAEKTFAMYDTLMKQKITSPLEYRNEQSKYLNKQQTISQINSSIIANENQQNDKEKEIVELQNTIVQQKAVFMQALNTLQSQVAEWKKKYLLMAPADGEISLSGFLEVNQQLKNGQTICYISGGNSSYFAQMYVPQANFGKVKKGEEVLLKFQAYPSAEWGSVKGKIDFISHIPTDSGYLAKIILLKGLSTDYNKQIQYHEGLAATGEIITANRRLLEQLYYNLYSEISR